MDHVFPQVWACVAASLPIVSAVLFLAVVLDLHQADDQTPASLSGSVDTLQRCLRLTVGAVFAEGRQLRLWKWYSWLWL